MRPLLPLLVGCAIGSTATYFAIKRPWQGAATATASVSSDARLPPDAASDKRQHKPAKPVGNHAQRVGASGETEPVSDEDRKMIWQGKEFGLPAGTKDMNQPDDNARPLSSSEISSGLADLQLVPCVVDAATGFGEATTVSLKLLVNGSGVVVKHRIGAPRFLFDRGLATCLSRALSLGRFAATGAMTLVTAPLTVSP